MEECSSFALQLELLPSLISAEPDFFQLQEHLKICTTCREKFKLTNKLDDLIKDSMADVTTPEYLKEKIMLKYAVPDNPSLEELAIPDALAKKLNWLAAHSLNHHLSLIGDVKQPKQNKQKYTKPKVISSIPTKNDHFYDKSDIIELNWNKCSLGDVEADFISFEEEGQDGSLYLLPDDKAQLKQWNGEKEVIQQGDYLVSIWKNGETVYSKVMKQA